MAKFLTRNKVNSKLEDILENADLHLYLVSPFIKFHDRIKEILLTKKKNPELEITLVYGKNENKKHRSFGEEDFKFLYDFPNVIIKYERRLHAKYYANESGALLSSMNLYEYSQNNNIEFGIYSPRKNFANPIFGNTIDEDAYKYFEEIILNSELMFKKKPIYKSFLGISKKYLHSEIEVDNLSNTFKGIDKKSSPEPQELLSATVLGKLHGITYKEMIDLMHNKKFLKKDKITSLGKSKGLEYKTNKKGDEWIVYPKDIL